MIYDCFIVFNELDLCEIRFNVLKDVVDKFVVVEGTLTHTGKPKPLYFCENKERFAAFADKIIHVVVDDFPTPPVGYSERDASWMREDWQRNAMVRGLKDAKPEDLVIISDVDEIPRPEVIARLKAARPSGVTALGIEVFCYYLNFKNYTHYEITAPKVLSYATLTNPKTYEGMRPLVNHDPWVNKGPTTTNIRCIRPTRVIKHAGWHFSYLGGAEAIIRKIGSIAIEYANEKNTNAKWLAEVIERGEDITGCGGRYFAVPLDGRYPKYLLGNRGKYAALIYEPDADYYRRTYWPRRKCFLRGWIRKNGAKLIPRPFKQFLYDHVYCKLVKEPIVM